ncbi:putative e3 ubiquitin-protein ligase triml1 [Moniliophthora roreri MCA 2997]|uniref:E3 ubiquitin-protein ligase triml1 n=1 Tax=Moniliophthora roreri (strain MCA 2997) TaxID=1381753 RepID=V2W6T8_MONRO|nr:putative e3 ubiquitin-protein ligase triml1 [Moniliophthora roreri MCA 2997]
MELPTPTPTPKHKNCRELLQELRITSEKAQELAGRLKEQNSHNEYIERKRVLLTCSMCTELLSMPYLLDCGYNICGGCLKKYQEAKVEVPFYNKEPLQCPVTSCEQEIVFCSVRNHVLDTVVQTFAKEKDSTVRKPMLLWWPGAPTFT